MRDTGVKDVYGLSIPVGVEFALGVTTHRYISGDGFNVFVKDSGEETVTVSIHMFNHAEPVEERKNVAKEDVAEHVKALFSRYRM